MPQNLSQAQLQKNIAALKKRAEAKRATDQKATLKARENGSNSGLVSASKKSGRSLVNDTPTISRGQQLYQNSIQSHLIDSADKEQSRIENNGRASIVPVNNDIYKEDISRYAKTKAVATAPEGGWETEEDRLNAENAALKTNYETVLASSDRLQRNLGSTVQQQQRDAQERTFKELSFRNKLGLEEGESINIQDDGSIRIDTDRGQISSYAYQKNKAEEGLEEIKAEYNEKYKTKEAYIRKQNTGIGGVLSEQGRRALADLERKRDKDEKSFEKSLQAKKGEINELEAKTALETSKKTNKDETFNERRNREKEQDVNDILAEFAAKGEPLSLEGALLVKEQRDKFDAKGSANKELGNKLDILSQGKNYTPEIFGELVDSSGDIGKVFSAFSSRVGEAKAKKVRNDFYKSKGWDQETIDEKEYDHLVEDLASGKATNLNDLVSLSEKKRLPDDFINAQLKVIGESENADTKTKILATAYLDAREISGKTGGKNSDGLDSPLVGLENHMKASVMQIGRMVYGGRIANQETANVVSFITDPESKGLSRFELASKILGYTPQHNTDLGDGFIEVVLQNQEDDKGLADFDLIGMTRLLDNHNLVGAMNKVENLAYLNAKKIEGEQFYAEGHARLTETKIKGILKLTEELEAMSLTGNIGEITGQVSQLAGRFKGAKAQAVASAIVDLIAETRHEMLGSAVTEHESAFLDDMFPKVDEDYDNFVIKLNTMRKANMRKINSVRTTYGMKPLTSGELIDKNSRVDLYREKTYTTQQEDAFKNLSDEDLSDMIENHPDKYYEIKGYFQRKNSSKESSTNQSTGEKDLYQSIKSAETGNSIGTDSFIRTRVEPKPGQGISTAYGPTQITKTLADGYLNKKSHLFDENEKSYLKKFVKQGNKMLSAKKDDPIYGFGGTGEEYFRTEEAMKIYEKIAKKMIEEHIRIAGGDKEKAVASWRGKTRKEDPAYFKKILG